jgi:signal transduction histidine kinase
MRKQDELPDEEGNAGADALTSARKLRVIKPSDRVTDAVTDNAGDYNVKILRPLFGYLTGKLGADVLVDIVQDCGLPGDIVERSSAWISHERFEHFLAAVREIAGSDEEFMRACAFEMKKQYGAFLLILRAMSVASTYQLMAKTGHMVCRVGGFSTQAPSRTSITVFYETQRSESRLNCLSRQAQLTSLPTVFLGMAPAKLKEHSCVTHGDKRCEYEMSWYEPLRLRWVGAGALIASAFGLLLPETMVYPGVTIAALGALGAATGTGLEMMRLLGEQRRFAEVTSMEMEKVIVAHAHATDDLNALRERERDWNRQIEERVARRTQKLNEVIERLQAVLRQRSGQFPAAARGSEPDAPTQRSLPSQGGRLSSMDNAVESVSKLVGELVNIASDDATRRELEPEPVSVDALVVQLRRQLKALMTGRDVRVTVFQTREAPASIRSVRSLLDRVLDNLLFNASRHTDRGSVVVEAGGTPGSLLLKVSDTGSGLSKEKLEEVFSTKPGQSPSHDRSSLAHAARMLDQIGGRIEIMSEPGVGTTVWTYIPIEWGIDTNASKNDGKIVTSTQHDPTPASEESMVGRVVRIRSKLHPVAD